ncbi:unnamed protein product [Bemisia tabaci]|uniref:Uncharacterized protein n=1 Tax=Bemisia tabaci TaxID=7038 RepID=A0A9P0C5G8_BEMTA|nr:unnamed protein product [Bemisia tabaci]
MSRQSDARPQRISTAQNKTLHLTGIGLAVQAFYINLTLDSVLGGDYIEVRPAGPPLINPPGVWGVNGVNSGSVGYNPVNPVSAGYSTNAGNIALNGLRAAHSYGDAGHSQHGYRDANGYWHDNSGMKNGYDVGHAYGGNKDYGVSSIAGGAYGDVNGRNKGHQVAGFSTSYSKNESGNKATYYDDGLGHGGSVQYGAKDQRFRDGAGNTFGGGFHDTSLKTNAGGNRKQYGGAGGYANTGLAQGGYGQNQLYGAGSAGVGYSLSHLNQGPSVTTVPLLPFSSNIMPTVVAPRIAPKNKVSGLYLVPIPNKLYSDGAGSSMAPK